MSACEWCGQTVYLATSIHPCCEFARRDNKPCEGCEGYRKRAKR